MKLLLLASFFCLFGCSSTKTAKKSDSYLDNVKQLFESGERALKDEAFEDAIKNFEEVRTKYPYSKYAALADLKLADTYFVQEKWLEAADAYDFYIRFHPRHEESAYAWYQIALSYYRAIPSDFFLFPKSYVKDQTATREALDSVERYLNEFPADKNVEAAQKMLLNLREQLARRDLHIAEYYIKRNKLGGVKARLEHVVETYPDTESGKIAKKKILTYTQSKNTLNGGDMGSTEDKNEK